MKAFITASAMAMTALIATQSPAQPFNPAGAWYCTVNARSNNPNGNYGLEVNMRVDPAGQLQAQGVVIYPQLVDNIQKVEGHGDWAWLPPGTEAKQGLFKFRMQPRTHAIITWFVSPVGPGRMYNLFTGTRADSCRSTWKRSVSRQGEPPLSVSG